MIPSYRKRRDRVLAFLTGPQSGNQAYRLTRLWIIRGLGFIYFNAYAIVYFQGPALWGDEGLLPIGTFINQVKNHFGENWFWELPSLFYFVTPDRMIPVFGVIGMIGGLVLMAGFANFPILFILWSLQLSFNNSGQLFYSYGWETQLTEFTFLAFFLVPFWNPRLASSDAPVPRVAIWAMRWMLFRLMFGAGMIKIRGDECWHDFTCMIYHYETQPNPHPLSYFYHSMPEFLHRAAVLVNHIVELIVPFGLFGPARLRRIAGLITIGFQLILISSGNLAWLNWLTILMCIPCFDDEFLSRAGGVFKKIKMPNFRFGSSGASSWIIEDLRFVALVSFSALMIYLSINPALNLVRPNQIMNTSYSQWHLVNSYGAFGSIGKIRYEVVIKGTKDENPGPNTEWVEYKFKCAPSGDVSRRPCLITPYHYHLDWQIWFSAMRPQLQEEWLFRLVVRLLENHPLITALFAETPFDADAPKFIKMDLYRYRFADWENWPDQWWQREFVREYMPPVSLETPLAQYFKLDRN